MVIYNFNKDKWISAWEYVDLKEKYTTTYGHSNTYYDPYVHKARRELVTTYTKLYNCFDYGCGKNPFYKQSEIGGCWDKYTEGFTDFNRLAYTTAKTLLLFDVLEHIYDPESFLLNIPHTQCIITMPIVPGNKLESLEDIKGWKHYKPGEHFQYFTLNGFKEFVQNIGWDIVYADMPECPPRVDIYSFVLNRDI
jgi:hypothetical protein